MSALKVVERKGPEIERFEIVEDLLPLHPDILSMKDVARNTPSMLSANTETKMERLNRFQMSLSEVVSLIMKNEIEKAHAVYKEACAAFFSQEGAFIYDKNKDAFDYVNNHFEEFAKWLLSNWNKAKQ